LASHGSCICASTHGSSPVSPPVVSVVPAVVVSPPVVSSTPVVVLVALVSDVVVSGAVVAVVASPVVSSGPPLEPVVVCPFVSEPLPSSVVGPADEVFTFVVVTGPLAPVVSSPSVAEAEADVESAGSPHAAPSATHSPTRLQDLQRCITKLLAKDNIK
jgi:hypothetical protein